MPPFTVIAGLKVSKNGVFGLSTGAVVLAIDPFDFECSPETLHRGIVVAATH